jgi:hypothetical protein
MLWLSAAQYRRLFGFIAALAYAATQKKLGLRKKTLILC